jgi:Protein of unknown function (DUF2939)
MRARWPVLAMFLSVGVAYVAYPYITLYRLGQAIRSADAATLETLVDWPSVREGIKEDICDLVVDEGSPQPGAKLPPFGASFMRGIASSTIDQKVTPQAIAAASVAAPASKQVAAKPPVDVHIDWAFFDSPTEFNVSLRTQGLVGPIKLEMALHDGEWQVRRVWLPPEMLTNAPART